MSKDRRRRRAVPVGVVALMAALAILLALPLTSLGDGLPNLGSTVSSLVNNVTSAVQKLTTPQAKSGTTARSTAPAASAPASKPADATTGYTPPAYGSNPHGQGGVASISVSPSATRPYTYAPVGSSGQGEAVVIGRGRSEQQPNGSYDSHTTIAALLGMELLGVNANQGESNSGPLNSVQQAVLNNICSSSQELMCLTILAADTSATSNGATTHYQTAGLSSKQLLGLSANAASSDSSISTSGNCQSASGSSQLVGLATSSGPVAGVASSDENSNACAGQTPTQTASSSDISLGQTGLPLPAAGCANGTPNTPGGIPALLPIVCNADDTTQMSAPFGVREALTLIGVQTGSTSAIRAAVSSSESHAVAPSTTTTTPTPPPPAGGSGGKHKCSDSDHDCGVGPGGKPEKCVGGKDPDGDGDCTAATSPAGGSESCNDADHDCGIGPNGEPEVCSAGVDPDGDGDCTTAAGGEGPQVTALAAKTTLPFTGENVLEVILVGLILTGGGFALANRTRKPARRPR